MNEIGGPDALLVGVFDSTGYQALAVLVAFGVGAAHAVAPGHGKTFTAAYLVGVRARYRDAVALGAVVAVMHSVSSLALALAWVSVGAMSGGGTTTVTLVLQAVAGVAVVCVGVGLVIRRDRGHSHSHGHEHGHRPRHGSADGWSHEQAPERPHAGAAVLATHASPGTREEIRASAPTWSPWTRRGLVTLGVSGGLVPSPSAFLVLVSGLLTGRWAFAALLVAVFGLGMAATLTGVGVATLKGRSLVDGATSSPALTAVMALLPILAGYGVLAGGLVHLTLALSALR